MTDLTRAWAEQQDAADDLAPFRDRVYRPDPDLLYLDGNSLGMLPLSTRERLHQLVDDGWGRDLVRGWQHWDDLPLQAGDRVGALIGAAPGQVVVCDSISVNLYKLAVAALEAQPGRKVLITDTGNFPTDRYVLQGAAERRKGQLRLVPTDPVHGVSADNVHTYLADDVAMVSFSHVDYRSAAINDVVALTEQAHAAGALVLWDLAHSVGSVPIDLDAIGVDLAVGCTYKYLNAGPGAPAFIYVRRDLQQRLSNPIQGWWSVADPFDMDAPYRPADGMARWHTGTPPIPGLVAVDEGAALLAEAGPERLRAKSMRAHRLPRRAHRRVARPPRVHRRIDPRPEPTRRPCRPRTRRGASDQSGGDRSRRHRRRPTAEPAPTGTGAAHDVVHRRLGGDGTPTRPRGVRSAPRAARRATPRHLSGSVAACSPKIGRS